jgi:hypothetical protein
LSGRLRHAHLPALAALAGSAIGGLTSVASAWLTLHHQARAKRLSGETTRRQKLYKQFIHEASRLYADALVRNQAEVSARGQRLQSGRRTRSFI